MKSFIALLLAGAFASGVAYAAAPMAPPHRQARHAVVVNGAVAIDVDTYHNDNLRSGWNRHERTLAVANVTPSTFGMLFSVPMDGLVFSQPLIAANEAIPSQGTHNLLIAATQNDTLFANDADTGAPIWRTSFANPSQGITPVPVAFDGCDNVGQQDGVLSTPVIDRTTDTIYAVAATLEGSGSQQHIHYRLHAVSLATGADKMTPADIAGTFNGPSGPIAFDPSVQFQRPALLESQGNIYVAFGSQCDFNAFLYSGWVFAYGAATLQQNALISVTPTMDQNGSYRGGIWMSGYGLAADQNGRIFFAVGNGTFDGGQHSFGDSVLRLPPNLALSGFSFFTPYTAYQDNENDGDTGSGGVMLLASEHGGTKHLAVAQGKDGVLFLLDQRKLGGFVSGGPDHVLAELSLGGVWGGPAYWSDPSKNQYVLTTGGPLYEVLVGPSSLTVTSQTSVLFASVNGNGSTPSVSSNGNKSGTAIVWIVQRPSSASQNAIVLYAFDPTNLANPLFSAPLGYWAQSDCNPTFVPTIANGKVYVPTANSIAVFGLE